MMYKIGIVGHSIENIKDRFETKEEIENTLDILKHQYGENLVINSDANIGVGHWAVEKCLEKEIKYHLFLPSPVEDMTKHWYDYQRKDTKKYFDSAWAITIASSSYNKKHQESILIDDSSFMVFLWNGKKQGNTYDYIRCCLERNKMALNAFDNLNLISFK